jgi:hypothetical protein
VEDFVELPTYVGLLWPTLLAVRELGGVAGIKQIDAKAIELASLTAAQRARMHAGGRSTEVEYRLAWARTALKGMGALENSGRAVWRVTPLGRSMPAQEIQWRLDMYLAALKDARRDGSAQRRGASAVRIGRVDPGLMGPTAPPAIASTSLGYLPAHARVFEGPLPDPAEALERNFAAGGVSLLSAVFQNTFFAHPSLVRCRTPYFPAFARYSRKHYGTLGKGQDAIWQGAPVRLDDNSRAQMAWQKYTGRALSRGTGFGLRHIWGHPWDPVAFTAGWNFAYMPHWAGMLTEDQHAHSVIQQAVRQASWDLFFGRDPVCARPDFVADPQIDLAELLHDQPLNVLAPAERTGSTSRQQPAAAQGDSPEDVVRALRARTNQSWSNINKAIASLQGRPHPSFGTANVEASAKSLVRRMCRDGGLELHELELVVARLMTR